MNFCSLLISLKKLLYAKNQRNFLGFLRSSRFQSLLWNSGADLKIGGHVEQYALGHDLDTRHGRSLRKKLPVGN